MNHQLIVENKEAITPALTNLIKDIEDSKKKDIHPGKVVVKDQQGKVLKVTTVTGTKTRVEQSHKEDLDINRMLEPVHQKGLLRHSVKFEGQMDDIPVGDFQEAMIIVAKGNTMFEELPSNLRTKFETPENFLNVVQNPANKEMLKELGILKGLDGLDRNGQPTGYNPVQDDKTAEDARLAEIAKTAPAE